MRLQSLDSCFILEMICGDKLKVYGRFFDELCLLMTGFDRGQRVSAGEQRNWTWGWNGGYIRDGRSPPRAHLATWPLGQHDWASNQIRR